jgi:hypothetical protein
MPGNRNGPAQVGNRPASEHSDSQSLAPARPAAEDIATTEADTGEYLAGLKRRRAASLRLPPLPTGKRDPWDVRQRDGQVA